MIQDLKSRIAAGRVIIFVGTGVSQGAAQTPLAGWKGFLETGIRVCETTLSASLPERWAQRQREALEQGDLDEWLNTAESISVKLRAPLGGEFRRWLRETVGDLRTGVSFKRAIWVAVVRECPKAGLARTMLWVEWMAEAPESNPGGGSPPAWPLLTIKG
jgi:hypothetical protein